MLRMIRRRWTSNPFPCLGLTCSEQNSSPFTRLASFFNYQGLGGIPGVDSVAFPSKMYETRSRTLKGMATRATASENLVATLPLPPELWQCIASHMDIRSAL